MSYAKVASVAVIASAALLPLWTHVFTTSQAADGKQASQTRDLFITGDVSRLAKIELLYVLDPNFYLCWEAVPIDEMSRSSLLPWLLRLKDFATQTLASPGGGFLEVRPSACRKVILTARPSAAGSPIFIENRDPVCIPASDIPDRCTHRSLLEGGSFLCSCQMAIIERLRCRTLKITPLPHSSQTRYRTTTAILCCHQT